MILRTFTPMGHKSPFTLRSSGHCCLTGFSLLKHVGIPWNKIIIIWCSVQIPQKALTIQVQTSLRIIFPRHCDSSEREETLQTNERVQILPHNLFEEGCQVTSFSFYLFPLQLCFFAMSPATVTCVPRGKGEGFCLTAEQQ